MNNILLLPLSNDFRKSAFLNGIVGVGPQIRDVFIENAVCAVGGAGAIAGVDKVLFLFFYEKTKYCSNHIHQMPCNSLAFFW